MVSIVLISGIYVFSSTTTAFALAYLALRLLLSCLDDMPLHESGHHGEMSMGNVDINERPYDGHTTTRNTTVDVAADTARSKRRSHDRRDLNPAPSGNVKSVQTAPIESLRPEAHQSQVFQPVVPAIKRIQHDHIKYQAPDKNGDSLGRQPDADIRPRLQRRPPVADAEPPGYGPGGNRLDFPSTGGLLGQQSPHHSSSSEVGLSGVHLPRELAPSPLPRPRESYWGQEDFQIKCNPGLWEIRTHQTRASSRQH